MEKTSTLKRITKSKNFMLIIVLAIIIAFFYIIKPTFLTEDNLRNIATASAEAGIMMVGITCLLISGNMDLSTGGVGALSAVLMAMAMKSGIPWPVALLLGILFGAFCGGVNAFLAYVCGLFPFIGTLAMSSVWTGTVNMITGAQSVVITNKGFSIIGSTRILGVPTPFVIMLALMVIYGFILAKTNFGRTIYMVGGNFQAARLAGINLKKVGTILMINCSAISALTGCILASRMRAAAPSALLTTGMSSITAAILGGVAFTGGAGSMVGGCIGLLLLQTFTNGLVVLGLGSYWRIVASGILLIVALAFDYFSTRAKMRELRVK